jgi:hypothetical protein
VWLSLLQDIIMYEHLSTNELIEKIEDLEYELGAARAYYFFFKLFLFTFAAIIVVQVGIIIKCHLNILT